MFANSISKSESDMPQSVRMAINLSKIHKIILICRENVPRNPQFFVNLHALFGLFMENCITEKKANIKKVTGYEEDGIDYFHIIYYMDASKGRRRSACRKDD